MKDIDPREAASALTEIDSIARRVRQSRIYHLSSMMLVLWGVLVFDGNIAAFLAPPSAGYVWIAVNLVGVLATFAIVTFADRRMSVPGYDFRVVAAFVLFFAFGNLWSIVLGHFMPRQLGVFWPTYFMMVYTIVGLWVGRAFVAIGLGITALTLIGYFFAEAWFDLWMAVVNGGGLVIGGLWMRRN